MVANGINVNGVNGSKSADNQAFASLYVDPGMTAGRFSKNDILSWIKSSFDDSGVYAGFWKDIVGTIATNASAIDLANPKKNDVYKVDVMGEMLRSCGYYNGDAMDYDNIKVALGVYIRDINEGDGKVVSPSVVRRLVVDSLAEYKRIQKFGSIGSNKLVTESPTAAVLTDLYIRHYQMPSVKEIHGKICIVNDDPSDKNYKGPSLGKLEIIDIISAYGESDYRIDIYDARINWTLPPTLRSSPENPTAKTFC